jgi:hypothetical protein
MTDAPATTSLPTQDGKPTFGIVPTLDGYLELAARVEHLEANVPATGDDDSLNDDDAAQLHERLDRHRAELEEIKRRYNALIRYLDSGLTPSAPVQADDTVQPASRNMIQ